MKKINNDLYIGPQINEGNIKDLVNLGIRTIVCNRPDNEGEGQTNIEVIKREGENHGLSVEYIPFSPLKLSMEEVKSFAGYSRVRKNQFLRIVYQDKIGTNSSASL